ncbi:hypothetical protein F4818DRAFT_403899 [Hypoxylon cercidicola]|nr:hypothetical protein F4818DRAFT_403899 [Hypoxylon cercidicola]
MGCTKLFASPFLIGFCLPVLDLAPKISFSTGLVFPTTASVRYRIPEISGTPDFFACVGWLSRKKSKKKITHTCPDLRQGNSQLLFAPCRSDRLPMLGVFVGCSSCLWSTRALSRTSVQVHAILVFLRCRRPRCQ